MRGIDFFKWCASTTQRFNRIVANPPYVAIRKLHPTLQQSVTAFGAGDDGSFALRSNYWCAFLSASLRLANHGSLAFVLPAAWDYAMYAADVRCAIYQQFQSIEVHRSREPLFPEVREGCVVLVAKGYRKDPARSVRINHSDGTRSSTPFSRAMVSRPIIAHQRGLEICPSLHFRIFTRSGSGASRGRQIFPAARV